jgi:hypothetical protein
LAIHSNRRLNLVVDDVDARSGLDYGRSRSIKAVARVLSASKSLPPFPEGTIRGDHDRSNFITVGGNLEQQIGATLVDGQVAQLIEEEKNGTVETFNA